MHAFGWFITPLLIGAVLAAVIAILRAGRVRSIYEAQFQETRRERM